MRNYQCKKTATYSLPHNVYMMTNYILKDYTRMLEQRNEIMHSSPSYDGQPRAKSVGDPTAHRAIKLAALDSRISAVEQALKLIPPEYTTGILRNICDGIRYPDTAHYNTWRMWRQRLAYAVAEQLQWA